MPEPQALTAACPPKMQQKLRSTQQVLQQATQMPVAVK